MGVDRHVRTTAYRVCAWCGSLLDVGSWAWTGEETVITHGVCGACEQRLELAPDEPQPPVDEGA